MMEITVMGKIIGIMTTAIMLTVLLGTISVNGVSIVPVIKLVILIILIVTGIIEAIIWLPVLWSALATAAKKPGKYSLTSRHIGNNDEGNSNE